MATLTIPCNPDHSASRARRLAETLHQGIGRLRRELRARLAGQRSLTLSYRHHPAAHHVPLRVWRRQGALLAAMHELRRG
ncbi:hypothetical protein [Thioalbus denitrificans]|jgi:hypothetical protein|uniref:Uncharacterized protein n=1 Tax=Thioalbus denitrificans TaxID=547122 RepID=A0A369CD81_9GAMM|nr:hypothetical protein [Thioalbus denitrificans]RCX31992.1 hypothetical protein DFQ59_102342 [Thioalbus denitrificans]